jgi:ubiquinone/menaquinone biosynthesis C-methylase UbiE
MVRRLDRRARERAPLAKVLRAPAEDLPFEDGSFDVAVSTLVLCGVSDRRGSPSPTSSTAPCRRPLLS